MPIEPIRLRNGRPIEETPDEITLGEEPKEIGEKVQPIRLREGKPIDKPSDLTMEEKKEKIWQVKPWLRPTPKKPLETFSRHAGAFLETGAAPFRAKAEAFAEAETFKEFGKEIVKPFISYGKWAVGLPVEFGLDVYSGIQHLRGKKKVKEWMGFKPHSEVKKEQAERAYQLSEQVGIKGEKNKRIFAAAFPFFTEDVLRAAVTSSLAKVSGTELAKATKFRKTDSITLPAHKVFPGVKEGQFTGRTNKVIIPGTDVKGQAGFLEVVPGKKTITLNLYGSKLPGGKVPPEMLILDDVLKAGVPVETVTKNPAMVNKLAKMSPAERSREIARILARTTTEVPKAYLSSFKEQAAMQIEATVGKEWADKIRIADLSGAKNVAQMERMIFEQIDKAPPIRVTEAINNWAKSTQTKLTEARVGAQAPDIGKLITGKPVVQEPVIPKVAGAIGAIDMAQTAEVPEKFKTVSEELEPGLTKEPVMDIKIKVPIEKLKYVEKVYKGGYYGLTPKNALNKLLKAQDIIKQYKIKNEASGEINRLVSVYKDKLGIKEAVTKPEKIQPSIREFDPAALKQLPTKDVKPAVRALTGQVKVNRLIAEDKVLKAVMRGEEKVARKAFIEGKKEGIFEQKETFQEALAKAKSREELRNKINQAKKDIKSIDTKHLRPEFRENVTQIMKDLDLVAMQPATKKRLESRLHYIQSNPNNMIPAKKIAELERLDKKPLSELTVDDIQNIADAVKHEAKLNQLKNKLIFGKQYKDIKEVTKKAVSNIEQKVIDIKQDPNLIDSTLKGKHLGAFKKVFTLDSYNPELVSEILDRQKHGIIKSVLYGGIDKGTTVMFKNQQSAQDYLKSEMMKVGIDWSSNEFSRWSSSFQAKESDIDWQVIPITKGRSIKISKAERVAFCIVGMLII